MIYHICSSKFLWSGMFVIQEVIRHVIMAVLLEIHVFHLRLTLLYRGIVLPSVCERFYNRQDSVAGCWFILFSMYCKISPMEQTQTQAGSTKRLASSSPEKDNKTAKDTLCKTCSKPATEDILGVHMV